MGAPRLGERALVLGIVLLVAACTPRATGWDDEQDERPGFEVASEWARAAHGFPEDEIVLDIDGEAPGAEGEFHMSGATIEMSVDGSTEGFMQFAFNFVTGGFFSASRADVIAPETAGEGKEPVQIEVETEPAAMEILSDDEDELEQETGDEYHLVKSSSHRHRQTDRHTHAHMGYECHPVTYGCNAFELNPRPPATVSSLCCLRQLCRCCAFMRFLRSIVAACVYR